MQKLDWSAGNKFGRLMTTGKSYNDERSRRWVEIFCDCGTNKWMRYDTIKQRKSMSCGCYNIERVKENPPHTTHGLNNHPLWNVYRGIKDRCYRESHNRHENYDGVVMCDEWLNSYVAFYNWAIDKWKPGLQIDKDILYNAKYGTDIGKIYSPEFCCFVTCKENSRNKTTSHFVEFNGERNTLAEWSDKIGISQGTLGRRLNIYGWSIERTLTQPLKILKKRLLP